MMLFARLRFMLPTDQPLTSICTCIMERREARLSCTREREQRNRALESAEERKMVSEIWEVFRDF